MQRPAEDHGQLPELAYRLSMGSTIVEPHGKLEAIWNFTHSADGTLALDSVPAGSDWRGRAELGLRLQSQGGQILDFSAAYDGIGTGGYHALSGRALLRLPFN